MMRNPELRREKLSEADIAGMLGDLPDSLSKETIRCFKACNWSYRQLDPSERDRLILDILKRWETGQFSIAGDDQQERWEKGWCENLSAFQNSQDLSALIPKYIRPHLPIRLFQNYVLPGDDCFELHWYQILRAYLFGKYLKDVDNIYEFGCGTGHNLAYLASIYPDKTFYGMDWAESSCRLVDEIAGKYSWRMKGRVFNFFEPDQSLNIDKNSAVITMGALEQTGAKWGPFLEFILAAKPEICIHNEPIVEWYDPSVLIDYLAILVHKKRQFLDGYAAKIKSLAAQGIVEIIKEKRTFCGSLLMEGYSILIWRPVK